MTVSHAQRRNTLAIISLAHVFIIFTEFIFLIAFVESLPTVLPNSMPNHFSKITRSASPGADIFSGCRRTPYRAACESMLSSKPVNGAPPQTHGELFDHSVKFSIGKTHSARALAYNFSHSFKTSHILLNGGGMDDCLELLDDSLNQLSKVVNRQGSPTPSSTTDDVQTWLSAALTNQVTCLKSLENYRFEREKGVMDIMARNLSHFISNSLSLYMSSNKNHKAKKSSISSANGARRRLMSDGFPAWVSAAERRLLQASIGEIEASAVVAKDGSGTHETIGEALEQAASMAGGVGRTVIHVKAGTYNENLNIPTNQNNLMLVGDGKGQTVIVGSRSNGGGWTTFQSATFAAMGDGFIARDITFVNSAGPAKNQAVALRVGSDKSVIFRCSILGYQDTLYTFSKRQFYRETDIYGTIDFIFGNSAVVFQNCNIYARKPLSGQDNFITAQGRNSPDENTGISIHNCKIAAASDLKPVQSNVATYLGRPWFQYSRTVIMQSYLDDLIHPAGWAPWPGSSAFGKLYFGEYMNKGPGASVSGRVKWPGYHASLTSADAQSFTVAGFIAGHLWLPSTGVSFDSGLLG